MNLHFFSCGVLRKISRAWVVFFIFFPLFYFSGAGPQEHTVEITATGDLYLSGRLIRQYPKDLKKIKLKGDIVFGNFEGVLSTDSPDFKRQGRNLLLTMPLQSLAWLRAMGFNTLSLANNHSMDEGELAYQETYRQLGQNHFFTAGYNNEGLIKTINGITVRIVGFTFTGKNNVNDIEGAVRLVRSFHEDIIIVSAHMGDEGGRIQLGQKEYFEGRPRGNIRKFAHSVIDAGATIVIGHGPHFLRPVEKYKGKVILYSLGNFIFDYPGSAKNPPALSCVVSVTLNKKGEFIHGRIFSYKFLHGLSYEDKHRLAYLFLKEKSRPGLVEEMFAKKAPRETKK